MNSFENVCANCPLRTRVNLPFATQLTSMGSDGVKALLRAGTNTYSVNIHPRPVNDNDQIEAVWHSTVQTMEACDGPTIGLLRQTCAAGLASAWRWSEAKDGANNADTLDKIKSSLRTSCAKEALASKLAESAWIVGDPEDYVGLAECSPYGRIGYFKTTRRLSGTSIKLKKNSVFALDLVYFGRPENIKEGEELYHLNFFNGPSFHFLGNSKALEKDTEQFLAEAIHRLLVATPDVLRQSNVYAEEVGLQYAESERWVSEYVASGEFQRDIRKLIRRIVDQELDND